MDLIRTFHYPSQVSLDSGAGGQTVRGFVAETRRRPEIESWMAADAHG
jgi:hypothetical protein